MPLDPLNSDVVLIVDDIPENLSLLHDALDEAGYTVLVATNGESALQRARQSRPDVILLDALMPGMDGFEVLGTLNERGIDIPVIVLTADIQETARKKCIQMGAVDFLNKPPNDDELKAAMEKALAFKEEKLP